MLRLGMPFDLESLLSSSPPGFGLNLDIRSSFGRADAHDIDERKKFDGKAKWHGLTDDPSADSSEPVSCGSQRGQSSWLNEETRQRIANWEAHYNSDQSTSVASVAATSIEPPRKVSFADCLESVLEIDELFDEPPHAMTRNAVDDLCDDLNDLGLALDSPGLALNFAQPAADYLMFRNTVETQFVSLANAIVKCYRISGTVRVKNVAYEKSVVVRYTFNGWATHDDVIATYDPTDAADGRFDTFAFSIDCPAHQAPGSKLQFAIRYVAGDLEYWDSNGGENYEVLYIAGNSSDDQTTFRNPVFSRQSDRLWSEYSVWSDIDASSPYW